jgi:glycosyltransferase involved in cell wall biosynthesis
MVVDMCDDPRHYPGEPPWTHQLLVDSIRQADLVTTSSRWLQAEFRAMGAQRVELVPNGVSDEQLTPVERKKPRDLQTPVLGFVGHLGPWIDVELLERVADTLSQARLVLAGSVDPAVEPSLARLRTRPNVEYLGFVPHQKVPELIAGFDVGLMPFRVQAYTRAVNPIKLYEYAAQNVPVVSTAFSLDVEHFRESIDVCATAEEFLASVDCRARGGNARSLRWIAERHAWGAIAERFFSLIQDARYARGSP